MTRGDRAIGELERRLRDEPDNLGLRVALAGELREVGRHDDAVELYRSVAIAYRAQGRTQQAISVCRAVLDIAPDDASCQALLAAMVAERVTREPPPLPLPDEPSGGVPALRPSSSDLTPLPQPLPHHIAEPTIPPMPHGPVDRPISLTPADLPPHLRAELDEVVLDDDDVRPRLEGIANAARQISASLLAAAPEGVDLVEDEKTTPREQPNRLPDDDTDPAADAADPLDSALLAPLAAHHRAGVLQRFRRRVAAIGTTVIRRGEVGHGLVLVVRGRLDVHSERSDGARVSLEAIEPGDFVGEVSLLARAPAPAYVVAARNSELLVLGAADFYEVSSTFPRWRSELRASAERRTRAYAERLR